MKPTHIVKTLTIALFIGCASSRAQSWSDNLYLNTDIGPAFIPDATAHYLLYSPSSPDFSKTAARIKFNTGIRGDLSLGYHLDKFWAVELESGVIWSPGPVPSSDFYQIPIMARALYQVPLNDFWKVYLGVGAGDVVGMQETESLTPSFRVASQTLTDTSFGYEAETGIKYTPSRHLEIGLGYKFLGVSGYHYQSRSFNPASNQEIISSSTVNDLFIHTAFLSLTWKF